MEENYVSEIKHLLVIGGSAGSLEVLLQILPGIGKHLNIAIIIVLHRRSTNDSALQALLATKTNWKIKEAEEKEMIAPERIYIAPPDYHLLIENDHTFSLDDSEKVNYSRPSIDVTFECAAAVYGGKVTGLLLSGANADGVEGLKQIKKNGGSVAVQDPDDAEIPFMPQQALLHIQVDHVLKNNVIANFINNLEQ